MANQCYQGPTSYAEVNSALVPLSHKKRTTLKRGFFVPDLNKLSQILDLFSSSNLEFGLTLYVAHIFDLLLLC